MLIEETWHGRSLVILLLKPGDALTMERPSLISDKVKSLLFGEKPLFVKPLFKN